MSVIPLVDLKAQYQLLKPEIDAAIQRVIDTTAFINGPDVHAFEQEFAASCGARYAVGVGSGTSAIQLTLEACGIVPGDEVITVSHTFCATVEAIIHAGGTPVLVDIDPSTCTLDPALLEQVITPRTKALLPVHLYGLPASMDAINAVAHRHNLIVIEDAAQAHGATYHNRTVGTLGHAACFSFYPGKNLGAYGDAGAITTNDAVLAERVTQLRDHGRMIRSDGKRAKYEHGTIGYGERLDTLQAAILRAKLPHLPKWNDARRRIAQRYRDALPPDRFSWLAEPSGRQGVYHQFIVRVNERQALQAKLKAHGIESGIHYPIPVHLQPAYRHLNYASGSLTHTERVAQEILSLPIYPELSESDQSRVIQALLVES
jgi:dTDP-4-amino-4,6-dideoxygalactose transaminase